MGSKELVQKYLDKIIILKKEIDEIKNTRDDHFDCINLMNLDLDNLTYAESKRMNLVEQCEEEIKRLKDEIDGLWHEIEKLGGVYSVFDD